tara:strand:+ start:11095 stop:11223 length:129 start_codon:yes stop_codon:yes gene_type:complete
MIGVRVVDSMPSPASLIFTFQEVENIERVERERPLFLCRDVV